AGNEGTEQLSFAGSTHTSAIVFAINQLKGSTGVSAVMSGTDAMRMTSTTFGSRSFVSVKTISGTFVDGKNFGADATVAINGSEAEVDGITASIRTSSLDMTINLDQAWAQTHDSTKFYITGGGAKFQIGSNVSRPGQVHVGIS